jgi:hypothetical protein
MRHPWIIPTVLSLLSACATTSGVVPLGNDTYLISRSEKGFDTTGSRVKADALKEANKYCSSAGKKLNVAKTSARDMVPFKSDAQAEIEFNCVAGD